jgi:nitrogen fixation NifU-like protein
LTTREAAHYSSTTIEHFRHPRNVGRLDDYDGFGEVDDSATENYISFYLKLEQGLVSAARFRTLGCSACIAASSVATELALQQAPELVRRIDGPRIVQALGGLPAEKEHCAQLAARALQSAIDDLEQRTTRRGGAQAL